MDFLKMVAAYPPEMVAEAVASLPDHVAQKLLESITTTAGKPAYGTPGELAAALDERTVQTPALDLIDQKLVQAFNTPDSRLIISMPPQEGKSQRASRRFVEWVLTQRPDTRVIIASYQQEIATEWGGVIRDDIRDNAAKLGIRVRPGSSSKQFWKLDGHEGSVFCAGVGGAMTGKPADLLIIDDPVRGHKDASSPTIQKDQWNWWTGTAAARLAPGAPVILILTRWHDNDLAGMLMRENPGEWEFLRIPAQADHKPEAGEEDPLGREPGEFMVSARGRTQKNWEKRKREAGPKSWAALYQGTPSPDEGGIFPGTWARYSNPIWVEQPTGERVIHGIGPEDEIIQSWDLAFKGTDQSDYVVGQVWLRRGTRCFLLDMRRERLTFMETLDAIKAMSAKWPQAVAKFVEDKANGPAVINSLRGKVAGIIPVTPDGGKVVRANAVSPLAHSGDIILPEPHLLPNVEELVEEAKLFPNGKHDDAVDAMTQAVNQLGINPITGGDTIEDAEEWGEDGYSIGFY